MGDWEKLRHRNVKRNYEAMVKIGNGVPACRQGSAPRWDPCPLRGDQSGGKSGCPAGRQDKAALPAVSFGWLAGRLVTVAMPGPLPPLPLRVQNW